MAFVQLSVSKSNRSPHFRILRDARGRLSWTVNCLRFAARSLPKRLEKFPRTVIAEETVKQPSRDPRRRDINLDALHIPMFVCEADLWKSQKATTLFGIKIFEILQILCFRNSTLLRRVLARILNRFQFHQWNVYDAPIDRRSKSNRR